MCVLSNKSVKKLLEGCCVHTFFNRTPSFVSQAGLLTLPSDEPYSCPNPDCESGAKNERKMVFLERVLSRRHHGLPMVEPFASDHPTANNHDVAVQFHTCGSCFILVGRNRTG